MQNNSVTRAAIICLILAIPTAILLPRAAAFAPGIAGLILAGVVYWKTRAFPVPRLPELGFTGALIALAALSSLWAPDADFALERTGKIAIILLPALLLPAALRMAFADTGKYGRETFIRIMAGLYIACGAFLFLEKILDFPIYRILEGVEPGAFVREAQLNRNVVAFVLLGIPVFALTRQTILTGWYKHLLFFTVGIAALAPVVASISQTAQLGFLVGVSFLFLFPVRRRPVWIALGICVAVLALAAPWVVRGIYNPNSLSATIDDGFLQEANIATRLEIWSFIAGKALESPVYGNGIEATRVLKSDTFMPYTNTDNVLHPHNAVLQIWVEFGVIGIALACALFAYLLRQAFRAPENARAIYLATLMTVLSTAATGYGLWQSWQLGLFVLTAALCIAAASQGRPSSE